MFDATSELYRANRLLALLVGLLAASWGTTPAGEQPVGKPARYVAVRSTRPAPQRPDGLQVWICQPPRDLSLYDTAEHGEKKLEISLISPRNGRASGQVVLASAKPIKGIRASVGDLTQDGGKGLIAAKQVLVRFPAPGESNQAQAGVPEDRLDVLLAEPPAEVPVRSVRSGGYKLQSAKAENVGAVQPVWFTVPVPADAAPGVYRGKVTVSAEGLPAREIPLSLKVHGWTMPEPKDFTCRNNFWQSHESSALRYGVPLWSDRHFELMGQVLELTGPAGNGLCMVNLIRSAMCCGNSESMVRWIDKGGPSTGPSTGSGSGSRAESRDSGQAAYEYDFTVFDKYLDLYEQKLGKPRALLLSVFVPGSDGGRMKERVTATTGENPIRVSRLEAASGKVEPMLQPLYGSEESAAFWQPVLTEAAARLRKRGWLDVAAIGSGSDWHPTPLTVAAFQKASPDFKWFSTAHPNPQAYRSTEGRTVPIAFREHVWGVGAPRKPEYGRPWKQGADTKYPWGGQVWAFSRYGAGAGTVRQHCPIAQYRANPEFVLHTGWTGTGSVGADYWSLPGRKRPLGCDDDRGFGPPVSILSITGAGPNGPVSTERLEMFIEGMQVEEAIAFLLKSLDEKKLDGALAARCQEHLNHRGSRNLKIMTEAMKGWPALDFTVEHFDSWQEDDEQLFALCAEVGARLGGR